MFTQNIKSENKNYRTRDTCRDKCFKVFKNNIKFKTQNKQKINKTQKEMQN